MESDRKSSIITLRKSSDENSLINIDEKKNNYFFIFYFTSFIIVCISCLYYHNSMTIDNNLILNGDVDYDIDKKIFERNFYKVVSRRKSKNSKQ